MKKFCYDSPHRALSKWSHEYLFYGHTFMLLKSNKTSRLIGSNSPRILTDDTYTLQPKFDMWF